MARVTLVVNEHGVASETFLRSLGQGLLLAGHEVTEHALRPGGRAAPPLTSSSALPALRSSSFPRRLGRLLGDDRTAMFRAMRQARSRFGAGGRAAHAAAMAGPILATQPDVVHLSFSGMAVALADAVSLLGDVAIVVSCRGAGEMKMPVLDPARGPALADALSEVDAIHAVSGAMADLVAGYGVDRERITVIRPAIDLSHFPLRERRVLPVDGARVQLVAVARLNWVKGIEDLISAVAILRRHGRNVGLAVAGGGDHGNALRYRAHALGVADAVSLLGARPHEEVRNLVGNADVFVLPSLLEGISNAVLEAMATGVPVISTTTGGMGEVITDGVDGLLVPQGDPGAIAAAVERLLDEENLTPALVAAGRARVVAEFGIERQREEMASMYEQVLTSTATRRGDRR